MRLSKRSFAAVIILCFLGFPSLLHAETASKHTSKKSLPVLNPFQTVQPQVEVLADSLEYDRNTLKVIAKGNVVVRDKDLHLTSDYAEVATDSKKVLARGHVIIFKKGKAVSRGHEIHYDFATEVGTYPEGRIVSYPWIMTGREMQQVGPGVQVIEDCKLTTCHYEKPHYFIRAENVKIYEEDKMVVKNIVLYVLDTPVFWWPLAILPLQQSDNLPFSVAGGYNSRHGAYIETSAGFGINKNLWGKWHLDFRSLRGVGGGADLRYDFVKEKNAKKLLGSGIIKGYVTDDKRAPAREADTAEEYHNEDRRTRGRLTWIHRTDLDEQTNLILRYNRLADEFFLQDFFRRESRAEIEPQSFATFTKNSENFGFFTHYERQANRFERLVQKEPQVQFDWKTQPFLNEHLFYESQTSFANLSKVRGRFEEFTEDVTRYDTFHEWSLPLKWNQVAFTPFVDLRGTYFSREVDDSVDRLRALFASGIDVRTQYYKTWDASSDALGIQINQLRHIIEPVAQYRTVQSTVSDEKLGNFDSIDRLDDADIITMGVENRLQTKRVVNGQVQRVDIVSLNTYLSYEINPDGHPLGSQLYAPFEDGRTKSTFTIGSQEIVLRPYSWLQSETRFDFNLSNTSMRVFNQDLVLSKGRFRMVFGYRFIRDFIDLEGNEQYLFDGSFIINPLWSIGGYIRWRSGDLDEWQVAARRDLHDFYLDLGYSVRNSGIQENNKEIFFSLTMKAFPVLNLRSGSRATFAEPRIGQTVAGSNLEAGVPSQNLASSNYDPFR